MTVDFFITKADIRVSIPSSTLIGHNDTINSIKIVWHWNLYKKAMSKIFSKADFLYYSRAVIMSFIVQTFYFVFIFHKSRDFSPNLLADFVSSLSFVSPSKEYVAGSTQSITENKYSHTHPCICAHILHVNLYCVMTKQVALSANYSY